MKQFSEIDEIYDDSLTNKLVREKIDYPYVLNRQIDRTCFVGTSIRTQELQEHPAETFQRGVITLQSVLDPYLDDDYLKVSKEIDEGMDAKIQEAVSKVVREENSTDAEFKAERWRAKWTAIMKEEQRRLAAISSLMARLGFSATLSGVDSIK